jgi:hypothetical protein
MFLVMNLDRNSLEVIYLLEECAPKFLESLFALIFCDPPECLRNLLLDDVDLSTLGVNRIDLLVRTLTSCEVPLLLSKTVSGVHSVY